MLITVVLADDHAILREGMSRLLGQHEDIRIVGEAADGRQAVREALRHAPRVVVMDLAMPVLSGIEATRAIVASRPQISVLVLSEDSSAPMVEQALVAGARGYVSKKSSSEELVRAIRTVAAGKRYIGSGIMDPAVARDSGLASLTGVEREILRFAAEGRSNAEMATVLGLTARTVETYRSRMMRKLDLDDMAELVKFAIRHGIVSLD
jgi:DNA-binding NarL/FixJ family response regulator